MQVNLPSQNDPQALQTTIKNLSCLNERYSRRTNGKIEKWWKGYSGIGSEEVRRQEVIHELLYTEGNYVKDLVLIEVIQEAIRFKGILPEGDIQMLFGNIDRLLPLHDLLLYQLEEACGLRKNGVVDIGQISQLFIARVLLLKEDCLS